MAVRRKRIDAAFRNSVLTQLSRLSIAADPDTDAYAWTVILQLADRFQLARLRRFDRLWLLKSGFCGKKALINQREYFPETAAVPTYPIAGGVIF